jgi:DNA-binding NarL/FixJ family response regulator
MGAHDDSLGISARATTVVVVDDHDKVRDALAAMISAEPGLVVVGTAATVRDAIAAVDQLRPNIALLDGQLPDGSGIDVCRHVEQMQWSVRCIVLTGGLVISERAAAAAGACAYLTKSLRGTDIVDTIRRVADGWTMFSSDGVGARDVGPPT